jgi:hypothetical protein
LASLEGLEFLCRHEHGRNISEDEYRMELCQIWDRLKTLSLMMGRALSDAPPLFVRGDHSMIVQIDIPTGPLWWWSKRQNRIKIWIISRSGG